MNGKGGDNADCDGEGRFDSTPRAGNDGEGGATRDVVVIGVAFAIALASGVDVIEGKGTGNGDGSVTLPPYSVMNVSWAQ